LDLFRISDFEFRISEMSDLNNAAGDYRHVCQIQRDAGTTNDAQGQPVANFATVATMRAGWKRLTGAELYYARQVQAEATDEITMRWNPDLNPPLNPKDKLVIRGLTFNVLSVENVGLRNWKAVVLAKEKTA
jgi:SPP1 family predicted phage head-tail adaptor